MKRQDLALGEQLSTAQTLLATIKAEAKEDIKLWHRELKDRKKFADQKKSFEKFYTKQVERQ